MTLALTAGSYSVGLAALTWLDGLTPSAFPFWVAVMVLVAGASLVLTAASLAALERRREYGMLMALGARRHRLWRSILLEYGIVAVGGGSLGALMALGNWVFSAGQGAWWMAIGIVAADLVGALGSAWAGAAPVLWLVTRRSPAAALRDQ
jgi:ABC-type antimicrobial peptide transport system permease subunit